MQEKEFSIIECVLFVSGDPVTFAELMRALDVTLIELQAILQRMDAYYREQERGIQLYITESTVQMVSNKAYAPVVEDLLQPVRNKSFSQSMLETLSIVAYKQPVTRSDIEAVRGVRCDYSVGQLLRLGMIREMGRKEAVGRPMLLGTTDAFLRQFGLHSLSDLPRFEENEVEAEAEAPTIVSDEE